MRNIFLNLMLCTLLFPGIALTLEDKELTDVLTGFEARRDAMLKEQVANPYPADGVWRYADFALAALFRNERVGDANDAILKICREFPIDDQYHWHINLLHRIYFLFHRESKFFPGRLTPEAEAALLERFWNTAREGCKIEYADPERTWWIWGSENHGAMRWSGFWGTAQILSKAPDYRDRKYSDGTPVAEMAAAWNRFYRRYARERVGKGMLVENGSGYTKYTLQGWYNMADFAEDEILQKRMKMLLDLFWADWAIEQLDAVRGGGKHRIYTGRTSTQGEFSQGRGLAWFYFDLGTPKSQHPSLMCGATSAYRPPLCVVDMALDVEGRGTYEYISRRPGLNLLPKPEGADDDTYVLRPDYGGILRYTYCTPDFVIGASMVEVRPQTDWSNISSQNRWDGVIFAGHPDSRIFVQSLKPKKGSVYNTHWSVQNKGALIVQKLKTHKGARGFRIWFSGDLKRTEESGWTFAEAKSAYAAVRVARGGTRWEPDTPEQHREETDKTDDGMWLACEDEYSPIIIEAARKTDFRDCDEFKTAIKKNQLSLKDAVLQYTGMGDAGTLTLYTDWTKPPEMNGKAIDFRPKMVYDSPFIQSEWDSGVVVLQKDTRRVVLDFNEE
ncbi:MAG: hypothetical protein AB1696_17920 [Planctomycetota bacterium]